MHGDHKPKLLIIEADLALLTQLRWQLDNYDVLSANHFDRALEEIRRHEPQLVLLDIHLGGDSTKEGFRCLTALSENLPSTKTIVITDEIDTNTQIKLLEQGVHDIFIKPLIPEELEVVLRRALLLANIEQIKRQKSDEKGCALTGVISQDPGMIRLTQQLAALPQNFGALSLVGPKGAGKRHLVECLHATRFSHHDDKLLHIEKQYDVSEAWQALHARTARSNLSLCISNLGALSLTDQQKLAKIIHEEKNKPKTEAWGRLGRTQIILISDVELGELTQRTAVHPSLALCFSEFVFSVPALRARPGDAHLLANYFVNKHRRLNPQIAGLDPNAIAAIEAFQWRNNVRELEQAVKKGMQICRDRTLAAEDLGLTRKDLPAFNLRRVRETAEKEAIKKGLQATEGNMAHTAKLLGVSRPTLYDMIKKYGIETQGLPTRIGRPTGRARRVRPLP